MTPALRRLWGGRLYHSWRSLRDRRQLLAALAREEVGEPRQPITRVAILFIGTFRYVEFFPRFHATLKELFLPDTPREFFVFTDRGDEPFLKHDDVTVVPVPHEPFPRVNLLKFKYLRRAEDRLREFSHAVYIDADIYAVAPVRSGELFGHDRPLFAVQHYNFVGRRPTLEAFESDPASRAAVRAGDDLSTYWQSCFWGGQTEAFLEALAILDERTDADMTRNIVARWWDESFLNKYLIDNNARVHTCSPAYAWPEHKPVPGSRRGGGPHVKLAHTDANPPRVSGAPSIKDTVRTG